MDRQTEDRPPITCIGHEWTGRRGKIIEGMVDAFFIVAIVYAFSMLALLFYEVAKHTIG